MLEASLRDIDIPPRPAILDRIEAEMRKPEPDFRSLADLIVADVALAAGLLKTVNRPYFGFEGRARTVMQALMMLGLELAGRVIAGLILRRVFPPLPALERFWDGSARVARTSGWLVAKLGIRDNVRAADAYTFGLFRDCGIPLLLKRFPAYGDALEAANREAELPFTAVELSGCPTDHARLGWVMVGKWGLADELANAIRYHHEAEALLASGTEFPASCARLVALSQLAEHLVQRLTGLSATREWDKLGGACLKVLGIDGSLVELLAQDASPVVADILG